MGNRKAARATRKSAPVVIVNDPEALAQERALSPDAIIEVDQSEPVIIEEVADKVVESEPISEPEASASEPAATEPSAPEPAAEPTATVVDDGTMLASRFPTSAVAYRMAPVRAPACRTMTSAR